MNDLPENVSLAGEAYVVLRERILRGEMSIGKVISRRQIASELGMSLVPVSEALQRLEFEGLMESRPRAGTRVKIPTEQDVRGHYVVREALEVAAAKLFADVATAQERAELLRLAVRVDTLAAQPEGDRFLYLTLHEKLHRRIAECTRCQPLCEAIEKSHILASTWLCTPAAAGTVHTHQALIKELTQSTSEAAGKAMQKHVQLGLKNTLKRLAPYFQMPDTNGAAYIRGQKRVTKRNMVA